MPIEMIQLKRWGRVGSGEEEEEEEEEESRINANFGASGNVEPIQSSSALKWITFRVNPNVMSIKAIETWGQWMSSSAPTDEDSTDALLIAIKSNWIVQMDVIVDREKRKSLLSFLFYCR